MTVDISRERFLRASGLALAAGLAGCGSFVNGGSTDASSTPRGAPPGDARAGGSLASPGAFYVGGSGEERANGAAIDDRARVLSV